MGQIFRIADTRRCAARIGKSFECSLREGLAVLTSQVALKAECDVESGFGPVIAEIVRFHIRIRTWLAMKMKEHVKLFDLALVLGQ